MLHFTPFMFYIYTGGQQFELTQKVKERIIHTNDFHKFMIAHIQRKREDIRLFCIGKPYSN